MSEHRIEHPSSELLQAYAGGEIEPDRGRAVEAHLDGCARCRSELEAWSLVFADLATLRDLGPAPGFAERVMEQVELPAPAPRRVVDRVRRLLLARASTAPARHLTVDGIQDFVDRRLGRRVRQRVEAHLAACGGCRQSVVDWAPVFEALGDLPELAPATGFVDAVMARVRVEAVAAAAANPEPSWGRRLATWGRRLVPATRKGWALAGGAAVAPAVGVVALVAAVTLHPLLTFADLAVFARWRLTDVIAGLGSAAVDVLTRNSLVFGLWEAAVAAAQAPGVALAGFAAVWSVTLAAAWVLYRIVITPSLLANRHAKPSS